MIIHNVEELCEAVGCSLDEQEVAQERVEVILDYLRANNVVDSINFDKLDWLFSDDNFCY